MPVEPRLAELIAAERLDDAAALAEELGDPAHASELLERAGHFDRAASAALRANEPSRALRLAARGVDESLLRGAADALGNEARAAAASDFEARRMWRAAAIVHEAREDSAAAGTAWEQAGEPLRAATHLSRAGDDRGAARLLTTHLTANPRDDDARIALATILLAHDRNEAAASTLQPIPDDSPRAEDRRALLAKAFGALGLDEARRLLGDVPAVAIEPSSRSETPLLFGRYEVSRAVATTPTSRVLDARDRLSGRRVAIKVLRAAERGVEGLDAIARFERESRALERLRHPRVVPLLAYVPEGPAVVLPWMEGGSLADVLRERPVPPMRAVEIAIALLSALEEAHRVGILHRDVKPSNVLFDASGAAHLADFGAAHIGEAATTVTVGLIGSLAYMAPEQREGRAAEVASDLYGVGAMLYESMTGERPSPADELSPLPSALFPELTPAHDDALKSLLAREPSRRPENAAKARALLEGLSWAVTTEAPPPRKPLANATPAERHRLSSLSSGADWDSWIERPVVLVALHDASLALARAFARAGDDSLATIYRVDHEHSALWIEKPRGTALTSLPTNDRRSRLREILASLHAIGTAHGSIDRAHVFVDGDDVFLAFPHDARADATADDDLRALDAL